jgi:peptidoglycan/xylan/chitin deacetylase (PgdA/CDA1 family)
MRVSTVADPVALLALLLLVPLAACESAETTSVSTAPLAWQPPEATTILTFTFDDANDSLLVAAAILEGNDSTPPEDSYRGTFFIITGQLRRPGDAAGHFTPADVAALAAGGHEIGGHSLNHLDLTALAASDPYELRRQICNDRRALQAIGVEPIGFAYPKSLDDGAHEAVAACGYRYARDAGGLVLHTQSGLHAESVPPLDPLEIRALPSIDAAAPPGDPRRDSAHAAVLEAWIESVRDSGGGWLPITIHHMRESCGDLHYCMETGELQALVDWLRTEPPGIAVRTMDQVMLGDVLVANPSLEVPNPTSSPQRPSCFKRTGKSSNFPSITTPAPGRTGSYAEALRPTGSSPNPMIGIDPAGRGCPLPVHPGRHHDVRAYARAVQPPGTTGSATAALAVSVQIDGAWQSFSTGPALPVGADWSQLSYVTPTIPAVATAITYGVQYAGSTDTAPDILVDDFSIVER